jgi:peptide/nickel transport system permease protein
MLSYITKLAVRLVAVMLLVSLGSLVLIDLIPGSPAAVILGENALPEQVAAINDRLGLNDPFVERYITWVGDIATGDFGRSLLTQQEISDAFGQRLPVTIELALGSLVVALLIAVPVGVYAAYRPGSWADRAATFGSSALLSIPSFALAVILVFLFAVSFNVFPVTGWVPLTEDPGENFRHAFLPIITLALIEAAMFSRLLRNDMATTLQEDYILAARARGLPMRRVLLGHALRPSSFSLVTVAGASLGRLIGGTVIIEAVFSLPGIGSLAIQSIQASDYTTLRAVVMMVAIGYVVINALIDVLYHFLDPRLRASVR